MSKRRSKTPLVAPIIKYPETADEIIRESHWTHEQIYSCVSLCNSLQDELRYSMGLTQAEEDNLCSQVASIREYLLKHAEIMDQNSIQRIKRATTEKRS